MTERPSAIGIFSGLGGLEIGLQNAGFKIKCSVDIDPDCCRSLRMNHRKRPILCKDLVEVSGKELLKVSGVRKGGLRLLAGGPPCQPFSRSNEGRRMGMKDPRGALIWQMIRVAHEIEPDVVLMENVPGLVSADRGSVIRKVTYGLHSLGYDVKSSVLDAADYGVPQHRRRLFVIATRTKAEFSFPEPTHGLGRMDYVTANDAIGDLDDGIVRSGAVTIGGVYGHLLDDIPEGMNYLYYAKESGHRKPLFKWRSKYWHFLLKLNRNKPSTTIQANPGPYVGPLHWRNRHLSLAEAKRLQTIPDRIRVCGSEPIAWQQIGNAVPPLLAISVGVSIRDVL